MLKNFILISLLTIIYGCNGKTSPNTENLKGTWGSSGIKINEDYLVKEKKTSASDIEVMRKMSKKLFDNIEKNYEIMVINDSITYYKKNYNSNNDNYKDKKSYEYQKSEQFDVVKRNNKYYIHKINFRNKVDTMEIVKFSENEIFIVDPYRKMYINKFNRIE